MWDGRVVVVGVRSGQVGMRTGRGYRCDEEECRIITYLVKEILG